MRAVLRGKLPHASKHEALFAQHVQLARLPQPVAEYRFCPGRLWRFDFAWPDVALAVELEGGHWTNGRHTRGGGFEADCEKYSTAAAMGWRIIRATGEQVRNGWALRWTEQALKQGTAA
jgi:very-short-patch-repair endonuclease